MSLHSPGLLSLADLRPTDRSGYQWLQDPIPASDVPLPVLYTWQTSISAVTYFPFCFQAFSFSFLFESRTPGNESCLQQRLLTILRCVSSIIQSTKSTFNRSSTAAGFPANNSSNDSLASSWGLLFSLQVRPESYLE